MAPIRRPELDTGNASSTVRRAGALICLRFPSVGPAAPHGSAHGRPRSPGGLYPILFFLGKAHNPTEMNPACPDSHIPTFPQGLRSARERNGVGTTCPW